MRGRSKTRSGQAGAQRPAFQIDLRGHGDLTLSRPSSARERLVLGGDVRGRVAVFSGDTVVADLDKGPEPVELALAPGPYRVRLRSDSGYSEVVVAIAPGAAATVGGPALASAPFVPTGHKGQSSVTTVAAEAVLASPL